MLDANKLGALGQLIGDRVADALAGLSPTAGAILTMMHFRPGKSTSELALICGVSQPTAVRVMDGLERQGLVERGEIQGRVTPLSLTEAGERRALAFQQARLATLDGLLAPLSPEERVVFETLVDRILVGATTSRAFARTNCRLCEHDLCGPDLCPIGRRACALEAALAAGSTVKGEPS